VSNELAQVWVVIVNWQRPDDTIECIHSVFQSNHKGIKVLVVDNGSKDDSVTRIRETFPQIEMLRLPENTGFSRGYNSGIEYVLKSGASHIFLLNNDTVIEENTIPSLLASAWDVAVPKIMYYQTPTQIWAAGARWRAFPPGIIMIGYQKEDTDIYNKPGPLQYATGCAMMIKRSVLEAIPGFDINLDNYMEDYDFCYRVRMSGFTIGYVPGARVLHKVSQTLGSSSPARWKYQGKNTVLFYLKSKRLSAWYLYLFLFWFTFREILKGNITILPHFWAGVVEGIKSIQKS
jgi:GT2 family glycosyltransferase